MIESRPTFFRHIQRKTGLWAPAPLRFAGGYPCCCDNIHCRYCQVGTTPQYIEVTFEGYADKNCADCEQIDGPYILTHSDSDSCLWEYSASTVCGSTLTITARLRIEWVVSIRWRVWRVDIATSYNGNPDTSSSHRRIVGNDPVDCSATRTSFTRTAAGDPDIEDQCSSQSVVVTRLEPSAAP